MAAPGLALVIGLTAVGCGTADAPARGTDAGSVGTGGDAGSGGEASGGAGGAPVVPCAPPPRSSACPLQTEPFAPHCFDAQKPCDCPTPADEDCMVGFPASVGAQKVEGPFAKQTWADAWVWPADAPATTRYLVTLHGTAERSEKNFYWWYPRVLSLRAAGLELGIIAAQYHDPQASAEEGYLDVEAIYTLLDHVLKAVFEAGRAAQSGHIFHGFSRGSANQYALSLLDRRAARWSDTFIADSGAWPPDQAPLPIVQDAIDAGEPVLNGVRFYCYYGLQDHDPDQNGVHAQTHAAAVVESLGGTATLVADPTGCHSAFLQGVDSDRAWAALHWALETTCAAPP